VFEASIEQFTLTIFELKADMNLFETC
jgi:hypothetical protein